MNREIKEAIEIDQRINKIEKLIIQNSRNDLEAKESLKLLWKQASEEYKFRNVEKTKNGLKVNWDIKYLEDKLKVLHEYPHTIESVFRLKNMLSTLRDAQLVINHKPELKFYTYGFECPNISKLKTKEQKDNVYNKLLNQFEQQLKEWIYE